MGDHIRKRRLDLGLLQREVGELIGVNDLTIKNWELHHTEPETQYYPAIIRFLGYNPLPEPATFGERLVYARKSMGLTRSELSRRSGLDESSLCGWETRTTKPTPVSVARLSAFFGWDERSPAMAL